MTVKQISIETAAGAVVAGSPYRLTADRRHRNEVGSGVHAREGCRIDTVEGVGALTRQRAGNIRQRHQARRIQRRDTRGAVARADDARNELHGVVDIRTRGAGVIAGGVDVGGADGVGGPGAGEHRRRNNHAQ